jgi:hypothetical protein
MTVERFGEGPVAQPPHVPDNVYVRITTAEYHALWRNIRELRTYAFRASNALEQLAVAMPLETRDEKEAGPGYKYWKLAKEGQELLNQEMG